MKNNIIENFINNLAVGIDIEENKRFENKTLEKDMRFLEKIFTKNELNYCYSYKNPSSHLCARFCAKEAVVKALYELNIKDTYYGDIEILKREDKSPYCIIAKHPEITVKLSLSHSKEYSCASVMIIKNNSINKHCNNI